jgi:phosphoglycerol transferase MdoB-like AlkP superfamily enzyme
MNLPIYTFWIKRILWVQLFYIILRILFLTFNYNTFQYADFQQISTTFIEGFRFDLSIIFLSNILFTILVLIPLKIVQNQVYQKIINWIYWIVNILLFAVNIADFEYYKFIGRRTNFEVFGIIGDIKNQALGILLKHWYLPSTLILLSFFFIKFSPKIIVQEVYPKTYKFVISKSIFLLFSLGLTILIFRGGFQEKPLRINQAFSQNDNHLGNLTLNSSFTFLTTIDSKGTKKVNFFTDNQLVTSNIKRDRTQIFNLKTPPQNVVIIILESFAREYMGYKNPYKGYTPFLDSLAQKGLFFENAFANGRESIMAVPAITSAIPQLMDEPFITSTYQSNQFNGLGKIVKQKGYFSSFFHAARNGSMGFEGFTQLAGFDKYYGLNEYPKELKDKDFDGNWGIFDEPYLQYFSGELSKQKQPFVSCVFTLSSHHPYTIPSQYKDRFPKGKAEIHESIGYADFSLKKFFETASKQAWFQNTLFIITADHTQAHTEGDYDNVVGQYRVPLILYHTENQILTELKNISNPKKIVQHTDILPSVLDFLKISQNDVLPFGESIFVKNDGLALHYISGKTRMIELGIISEVENEFYSPPLSINSKDYLKNLAKIKSYDKLKSFIQFYKNGLIDNSWTKYNSNDIKSVHKLNP